MFIIIRNDDEKFVAKDGFTYTVNLQEARKWPTKEAAQEDCSNDEHVTDLRLLSPLQIRL
jgi:hypothetical protein